jgi:branched-chain amino acid transport system permease protein
VEGPIVGTIVFFLLQQSMSRYGAWYLIVLGTVAIVVALWFPRGLWGLVADRLQLRLFPTGYWHWPAAAGPASGAPAGTAPAAARPPPG